MAAYYVQTAVLFSISSISIIVSFLTQVAIADVNSGCPSWGCLPSGTFSLSSGVPSHRPSLKWSTEMDYMDDLKNKPLIGRGCTSDQISVVCAIQSGYISLDPASGKMLWSNSKLSLPYLPVMDTYGDIIGMDKDLLIYISRTGHALLPIDVAALNPSFSVMLTNNSLLLLTSPKTDIQQVVTYTTDGIVDGSLNLIDKIDGVRGTFIPVSQPVISGYRVYIMTTFVPDKDTPEKENPLKGLRRLFAIDLTGQISQRLQIAWFSDLGNSYRHQDIQHCRNKSHEKMYEDTSDAVVMYFKKTVYVNLPNSDHTNIDSSSEGNLWAFKDTGKEAALLFKTPSAYGQMAVFDTYGNHVSSAKAAYDQPLWLLSKSSSIIYGYNTTNGASIGSINITDLVNISLVTSKLMVTRQTPEASEDVLIFGAVGAKGLAYLIALEADSKAKANLLWYIKLNEEPPPGNSSSWKVLGQIPNFVHHKSGKTEWQLGLVAMVLQEGEGYQKLYAKGIF